MKRKILLVLLIVLSLLILMSCTKAKETTDKKTSKIKTEETATPKTGEEKTLEKPEMQIDKNKNYTAIMKTTAGEIVINLHAKETPITVNNFVYLARHNYYDGTIFHRAISGFMIQGGDPSGDGTGGPGYEFDDEPFDGSYTRGIVAMANAGPNTNGSQFFIMHQTYDLPHNYVIFGEVSSGMEAVDAIATAQVELSPHGEMSKPVEPVKIESVAINEM